jgi:YD repeat-containing protein
VIERTAHVTPFGVRLVDQLTGRTEAEGIDVTLSRDPRERPIAAFRTASGIFAAHWLPGFRAWELADVDDEGSTVQPVVTQRAYRLEVVDRSGRFFSFAVDGVLLPARGLLTLDLGSPPGSPPAVVPGLPLFSRPGRLPPASMAVVRAHLERDTGKPAKHAALEVVPAPGLPAVRGIADERGEVAVMFPYPKPPGFAGSPLQGSRRPLRETSWHIAYEVLMPLPGSPPDDDELPQLSTFLDQAPAPYTAQGSPPPTPGEDTVAYGRETSLPNLVVGA